MYLDPIPDRQGTLYLQLAHTLKQAILDGRLSAGDKLPATRELADELKLSRNTVLTAYELLCAEQLAVSRGGSGTYVAEVAAPARSPGHAPAAPPSSPSSRYAARLRRVPPITLGRRPGRLRYDLQYGEPLFNLPLVNAWRRELARSAQHLDLGYPPSQGLPALREAICHYLARRRGVLCSPDDVVVVSGTQQALSLVARVALDEGDAAVIEDPFYQLAANVLHAHGARVVSVPADEQGLQTKALRRQPAKLVIVTPSHQFPSGTVMSLQRRMELLGHAVGRGCWIFEDDYDGEFRYDTRPIPALRSLDVHGRVIYVGSFSKVMFPGLRLAYVVAPGGLRDDLIAAKRLDDLGCGVIEQAAMARFMEEGGFERHLRKASAELRKRRTALLGGLAKHCGQHLRAADSHAGMHVVGWLPGCTPQQLDQIIVIAARDGVGLHPIHPYYRGTAPSPGLLLGFAGLSPKQLRSAMRLLGQCLREVLGGA